MHDTSFVFVPPDFWLPSHFSKHDVDMIDRFDTVRFLDAIRYAAPGITGREFDLNAELTNLNVGKCL